MSFFMPLASRLPETSVQRGQNSRQNSHNGLRRITRKGQSAPLSRCPLLVEFALATLKIALNGRNLTFCCPYSLDILLPPISGHGRLRPHSATSLPAGVVG